MSFLISLFITLALSHAQEKSVKTSTVEKSELSQIKSELEELKNNFAEFSRSAYGETNGVKSFFAKSLFIGGFFENSVTGMWGEDTPAQTVADTQRLGLNLSANLSQNYRLVAQQTVALNYAFRNQHNNPSHGSTLLPRTRSYEEVSFGSLLSQGFLEYKSSHYFSVQLGMGYSPFGKAFQVRDPSLFRRYQGPQLIRTNGVVDIIIANPFWKGAHLNGQLTSRLGYNLYSLTPLDHGGKMGWGTRLWWAPWDVLEIGVSTQNAQRREVKYFAYGADLELSVGPAGLIAEYALNESELGHLASYYVQIFYKFLNKKLIVHFDYDYLKNLLGLTTFGTSSVNDPYVKNEYGVGINYQLLDNAKIRLQYLVHDYTGVTSVISGQNRDYETLSFSTGISF